MPHNPVFSDPIVNYKIQKLWITQKITNAPCLLQQQIQSKSLYYKNFTRIPVINPFLFQTLISIFYPLLLYTFLISREVLKKETYLNTFAQKIRKNCFELSFNLNWMWQMSLIFYWTFMLKMDSKAVESTKNKINKF